MPLVTVKLRRQPLAPSSRYVTFKPLPLRSKAWALACHIPLRAQRWTVAVPCHAPFRVVPLTRRRATVDEYVGSVVRLKLARTWPTPDCASRRRALTVNFAARAFVLTDDGENDQAVMVGAVTSGIEKTAMPGVHDVLAMS